MTGKNQRRIYKKAIISPSSASTRYPNKPGTIFTDNPEDMVVIANDYVHIIDWLMRNGLIMPERYKGDFEDNYLVIGGGPVIVGLKTSFIRDRPPGFGKDIEVSIFPLKEEVPEDLVSFLESKSLKEQTRGN